MHMRRKTATARRAVSRSRAICVQGSGLRLECLALSPRLSRSRGRQPMGKSIVSSVNSHTNVTKIGWHLWEIDLRFATGLPPGWGDEPEPSPAVAPVAVLLLPTPSPRSLSCVLTSTHPTLPPLPPAYRRRGEEFGRGAHSPGWGKCFREESWTREALRGAGGGMV